VSFNQPLDQWQVDNVTTMSQMFYGATSFNQSLDTWNWNVQQVQDMQEMFVDAKSFSHFCQLRYQGNWKLLNGKKFENRASLKAAVELWCSDRTRAISIYGHISTWITDGVMSMFKLFSDDNPEVFSNFNDDISNWDVGNVENMDFMFHNAVLFNSPLDGWNVEKVESMTAMFQNASSFNQSLSKWDVSNVKNMSFLFAGASNFNQPLDKWNVSSVKTMECMFADAGSFNQPLQSWVVTDVTNMNKMFYRASEFNQPIHDWNLRAVRTMMSMFYGAKKFKPGYIIEYWNMVDPRTFDMLCKAAPDSPEMLET
jgi:hypothetical protein